MFLGKRKTAPRNTAKKEFTGLSRRRVYGFVPMHKEPQKPQRDSKDSKEHQPLFS